MPHKAPQNPNHFLDSILIIMRLKNDAALSRAVNVAAPALSKLRHGRLPVTAALLLKLHDYTGLTIAELRKLLYHPNRNN
jgi:plasmid maintenance system antidote protein VapI